MGFYYNNFLIYLHIIIKFIIIIGFVHSSWNFGSNTTSCGYEGFQDNCCD